MSETFIRIATPADAAGILEIYAPYVTGGAVSFDEEVPEISAYAAHIEHHLHQYPWLVVEAGGAVVGYAYAAQHRARAAYRWSVESSIYLATAHQGTGLARRLYDALFEILRKQGFIRCYAGITVPNPQSTNFHTRYGFQEAGLYRNVGYKAGHWRDVVWLEYEIQPAQESPLEPVRFQLLKTPAARVNPSDRSDPTDPTGRNQNG